MDCTKIHLSQDSKHECSLEVSLLLEKPAIWKKLTDLFSREQYSTQCYDSFAIGYGDLQGDRAGTELIYFFNGLVKEFVKNSTTRQQDFNPIEFAKSQFGLHFQWYLDILHRASKIALPAFELKEKHPELIKESVQDLIPVQGYIKVSGEIKTGKDICDCADDKCWQPINLEKILSLKCTHGKLKGQSLSKVEEKISEIVGVYDGVLSWRWHMNEIGACPESHSYILSQRDPSLNRYCRPKSNSLWGFRCYIDKPNFELPWENPKL